MSDICHVIPTRMELEALHNCCKHGEHITAYAGLGCICTDGTATATSR
jgi:hypothetical protein